MANARTIVETDLVAARIDAAVKRIPNLSTLYEILKWRLARKPDAGEVVTGGKKQLRIAKTFSWAPGGVPSITVLYSYNQDQVIIESSKIDWPKNP